MRDEKTVMVVNPWSSGVIKRMSLPQVYALVTKKSSSKMWDSVRMFPGDRNIVIIYNDTCKFDGEPLNRIFVTGEGRAFETLEGTFVIVGYDPTEERYSSLTDEQVKKLLPIFADWSKPVNIMSFGQSHHLAWMKMMANSKARSQRDNNGD